MNCFGTQCSFAVNSRRSFCAQHSDTQVCEFLGYSQMLKPSAHSRFLSLRHAIVGFSSCRTQQIFIVDRYKARSTPPWNFFKRCVGMILRGKFACQHSYLCFSIGLVSHVFHDFCRDTPHTADFCFWSLAIKNKYQTCLISKLSLLR